MVAYQVNAADKIFQIKLPQFLNPENVTISYGIYSHGLLLNRSQGHKGQWDYQFAVPEKTRFKILITAVGYRFVAFDSSSDVIKTGDVFRPEFKSVKMVNLKGKLLSAKGVPCSNERVYVSYDLGEEAGFFGYADGSVGTLSLGSGETNINGEFIIAVPDLLDDPFIRKYRNSNLDLGLEILVNGKKDRYSGDYGKVEREFIPIQDAYKEPIILNLTENSRMEAKTSN